MTVKLQSVCIAATPRVETSPMDVTVKEGDPVDFSCSYDTSKQPLPKLTKWRITDNN